MLSSHYAATTVSRGRLVYGEVGYGGGGGGGQLVEERVRRGLLHCGREELDCRQPKGVWMSETPGAISARMTFTVEEI